MAKETLVRITDDLDGTVVEGEDSTVQFSLEGRSYEIDLSAPNLEKLREALAPFIAAGRPTSKQSAVRKSAPRRKTGGRASGRSDIREWARANGYEISERGRLSGEIIEAYENSR